MVRYRTRRMKTDNPHIWILQIICIQVSTVFDDVLATRWRHRCFGGHGRRNESRQFERRSESRLRPPGGATGELQRLLVCSRESHVLLVWEYLHGWCYWYENTYMDGAIGMRILTWMVLLVWEYLHGWCYWYENTYMDGAIGMRILTWMVLLVWEYLHGWCYWYENTYMDGAIGMRILTWMVLLVWEYLHGWCYWYENTYVDMDGSRTVVPG